MQPGGGACMYGGGCWYTQIIGLGFQCKILVRCSSKFLNGGSFVEFVICLLEIRGQIRYFVI